MAPFTAEEWGELERLVQRALRTQLGSETRRMVLEILRARRKDVQPERLGDYETLLATLKTPNLR